MNKVCLVRLKNSCRSEYFKIPEAIEKEISIGLDCIVETERGVEFAKIAGLPKLVEESSNNTFYNIVRLATLEDIARDIENEKKEEESYRICFEKIKDRQLPMKLVNSEYNFDASRVTFYFIAETRVDFKELVRDLSNVLKTRIEMKQIGVRDEARMFGGCGPCGRHLCCVNFLKDFTPVSLRMAKEQNLAIIHSKLSGMCGRLMCCLSFEHEIYKDAMSIVRQVKKEGNG